jgi:hypothetical protein
MQALKLGFARRVLLQIRRLRNPTNPNFSSAGRNTSGRSVSTTSIWTGRKRIEKLRYIHRNPVKRGLVASPELWRWSSYRAYAFGEAGPVVVNGWQVLKMKIRPPAA